MNKVRVWDLPTRVFHWGLVLCFISLVVTGEVGGEAMVWHFRMGYSVLSLLLFRLIWGFVGGLWSRFSSFVVGPSTIVRYARGQAALKESVGHNPLGSLSVLALLAFTLLQVVAGLCSDDEIATAGPIAKMLSGTWVGYATYYHTKIGKIILIVLVQLHIAAIIFYRVKHKEDLVTPMLKGDKAMAVTIESSVDSIATRCKAVIVFAICAGLVAGFVQWAG